MAIASVFVNQPLGGGVHVKTASYTATLADLGSLLSFNSPTPVTLTLPNPAPSSNWYIAVENVGTGLLTINRNGLQVDGAAANLTLSQNQGVLIYSDGTNYFTERGMGSGGGGGVNAKTASYTAVSGDNGKLITFSSSSALTLTLPASPPSSTWWIAVECTGSGGLTISPNGLNLDGSASNLVLAKDQGVLIYTDGTNYFTERGLLSSIAGAPIDTGSLSDGDILQYSSTTGKWELVIDRPAFIVSAVAGTPVGSQLVMVYTAAATLTFPANLSSPNSYGSVGTNPTATASYDVRKNGTSVATVSISTSGVFSFSTAGGVGFSLNAGDRLTAIAPSTADATLADVGFTIVGTRTATLPSTVSTNPLLTFRGLYNGSTSYNTYDIVTYVVGGATSTYICISPTTGNAPTNATYWTLMASGATNGMPAGGTAGQVLEKNSSTDYDASWQTPAATGFQKISEQILTGSASSVTFSSIPSGYRNLQLRYGVIGTASGDLDLRLNGDTGSNYDYRRMYGQNTSFGNAAADGATGATLINIGGVPNSGAIFGDVIVPGYSLASLAWKGVIARWVFNLYMVEVGGIWHSSSAISSITLFPSSGSFASGSFFSLYGEP